LRGALAAADIALAKPLVAASQSVNLPAGLQVAAGVVPAATCAYLLYSTAKDPLATARAAVKVVKEAASGAAQGFKSAAGKAASATKAVHDRPIDLDPTSNASRADAEMLADGMEAHGFGDWHSALLCAALDLHGGDVVNALETAGRCYQRHPTDNVSECPTGECCPHCGARLERGDDGRCNRCGREWPPSSQEPLRNARDFELMTDSDKIAAFRKWLEEQFEDLVGDETMEDLLERFARAGFAKGMGRAWDDAKKAATGQQKLDFYSGTKEDFLRSSFSNPVSVDRVKMLAERSFSDLEGVGDALAAQIQRTLMDGLVQGLNPRDVARNLCDDVDGVGKSRAETIARSEIIRAHAEGQLTTLEEMGMDEVGAKVEWLATPDDRVCPTCSSYEGKVYQISEARGMIPHHPNCRCCWMPADVGEKDDDRPTGNTRRAGTSRFSGNLAKSGWQDQWPVGNAELDREVLEFSRAMSRATANAGPADEERDEHGRWTAEEGGGDKAKFVGKSVGAAEHLHAESVKHRIAAMVGGVPEELAKAEGQKDKKPFDVRVNRRNGVHDDVEVKSLLKGSKQELSVHDDALLRKVEHAQKTGNRFHMVAVDERLTYQGGEHAENHSGHDLYYKRGSGRYRLSQMHKVSSATELKRLIAMPDHELPEKARGSLPSGEQVEKLRQAAAKAAESRKAKDAVRKARPEVKERLKEQARKRAQASRGTKQS